MIIHTCVLRSSSRCYVSITHKQISRAASYFRFTEQDTSANTSLWRLISVVWYSETRLSLFGCVERKLPPERAHPLHLSQQPDTRSRRTARFTSRTCGLDEKTEQVSLSFLTVHRSSVFLVYKSIINSMRRAWFPSFHSDAWIIQSNRWIRVDKR